MSLYLIKHYSLKKYGEVGLELHAYLILTAEWSAPCSCYFIPKERLPDTHWEGDWVCPIVTLDVVMKRRISAPAENQTQILQTSSP
jgi:hypothetical protein